MRSAQVQAGSKPLGVQQDAKGAAWPPRVASQLQTLLRLANLPSGSSSCPCHRGSTRLASQHRFIAPRWTAVQQRTSRHLMLSDGLSNEAQAHPTVLVL